MAPLKYSLKTSTDISINIPDDKKCYCEICNNTFKSANSLAGHIGAKHKIRFEDYLIKFYNNDIRPLCEICHKPTRYLRGEYCFKKFCVEHANESRKEWSLKKGFGKNNFDHLWRTGQTKETNLSIAKQSENISGRNNPSFLTDNQFKEKIDYLLDNGIETTMDYSEYIGDSTIMNVKCLKCKRKIVKKFVNLINNPSCSSCHSGKSKQEQEVYNYVLQICQDAIRNVKGVIDKELDIFIEKKLFAIEYNGLFWHTEKQIGKNYHSNKTNLCEQKGIKLFHIFSDEWQQKKEIIKSMINYRLSVNNKKIHARKCSIYSTDKNKVLTDFFDKTHVSGHTRFIKGFYLIYEGRIVCALSLRKSFQKKYNGLLEIARFSNELSSNVVGGFSKLLKAAKKWAMDEGYDGIFTYADLRFGKGEVYGNNGFALIGKTKPDYWYTDGKERFNRFAFRAQNGKTEKQIAEENSVEKIYGCGSNIYRCLFKE